VKANLKKAGRALLAAVTSNEAVKKEKSLAVYVAARVAINLGASASLVALIEKLAN